MIRQQLQRHDLKDGRQFFGRGRNVKDVVGSLFDFLITFGGETRLTPILTLPHPRAVERRFVLQPLSEINPELILPNQRYTVAQLLAKLTSSEKLVRLP